MWPISLLERRRVLRMVGADRLAHALHGTWVARPVRAAMVPPVVMAPGSAGGGGPSSVTTVSWARGRRARGSREEGLEPAISLSHSPRSWPGRCDDLRCLRTGRDLSCPVGTAASRCRADPARTSAISIRLGPVPSGRGCLRRSGPPRPGTDRPAGHGTADTSTEQRSRLLVGLVVDLSAGGVALDRLDAVDRTRLTLMAGSVGYGISRHRFGVPGFYDGRS